MFPLFIFSSVMPSSRIQTLPKRKGLYHKKPSTIGTTAATKIAKKYTNLPEEKRLKVKTEIKELANIVSYDELEPLFGTAVKKAGTRIATMIALKVLLENGLERNDAIDDFVAKAKEDKAKSRIIDTGKV